MVSEANTKKSLLARYRCVRYLFHLVTSVMDPSKEAKNRVIDQRALDALAKELSESEVVARKERLESVVAALLEASVKVCTNEELAHFDGSVGLDATVVPLYSRGPSARAGTSASDPDGGWYVREGDHRDVIGPQGKKLRKLFWANEATIVSMGRAPGAVPTHPNLILAACLSRPGEDPGGTAMRLLSSVRARGYPAGFLGADRGYSQPCRLASTSRCARSATRWSWTTRGPSSGVRPTAPVRSWSMGCSTARPCPKTSSQPVLITGKESSTAQPTRPRGTSVLAPGAQRRARPRRL